MDVSEARVLPPLQIISRSLDHKFYKVLVEHPSGEFTIVVRDSLFTPKNDGNFTILKADVVDFMV